METYEAQLLEEGVIPQTDDWPERSKFWLYAHGVGLDPKTGLIVAKGKWKKKIEKITKQLVDAIDKVTKGVYIPDRENDELTLTLGNPEHVGRVRTLPGLTRRKCGRSTLTVIEAVRERRRSALTDYRH